MNAFRPMLLVVTLLAGGALARQDDCESRCADDQKNCQVQCEKKAGKHAAACKGACESLVAPCHDNCKSQGKKK